MEMMKTPVTINGMTLANRLVMPPMASSKSGADGSVTDVLVDYYAEKAAGGYIGMIITEHSYISMDGKAGFNQVSLGPDCDMEGLKRMVAAIQKDGTKVICQLNHAGGKAAAEVTGSEPMGPSSVQMPNHRKQEVFCREMTQADIDALIQNFAAAAVRAKEAGFDGVEIHSAHGYLLNQFFSPLTNKRKDRYTGDTLEGRMQLHLEVIAAVRAAVGKDYPVAIRLGACDYMEGGITIEDGVQACVAFEKAGIDLLDISGGFCIFNHPTCTEQGFFGELSEAVKQKVSVPVIVTGGVVDIEAAERLVREGKTDLVGVGRAILKDSNWAKNAMA